MKIWLISDTHFGHENMYKFVGLDGVTRVRAKFQNAKEADEYMIEAWNSCVKPEDHIYHLGDVAFGPIDIVTKLQGKKRLVLGNHDFEKMAGYHAAGFQKIYGMKRMGNLWLTHAPVHPGQIGGKVLGNVHGHIHERPSPEGPYVNVSVEQIDYKPVLLDEVISTLEKRAKLCDIG